MSSLALATPTWTQRALAALISLLGTAGVSLLVLSLNGTPLRDSADADAAPATFAVQAPTPKKPPAPPQRARKPPKAARAAPPPAPLIGAGLSGMSFGLDALAGGLGDDAEALLGDVDDIVMTAETVDALPSPLHQPPPAVPERARQQGLEGLVVVSLLISTEGRVQDVRITESRPPGLFDEGVLSAVQQWTFRPATYQGQPVPLRIDYPFRFTFN